MVSRLKKECVFDRTAVRPFSECVHLYLNALAAADGMYGFISCGFLDSCDVPIRELGLKDP